MAGKRQATSDLNHENWDREEEPEDRGTFRTASESELKNRVIRKVARRRPAAGPADNPEEASATKSVFSGFSGFGKPAASTSAAASPFSFLSKIPAASGSGSANANSAVSSSTATSSVAPQFSFGLAGATSTASTASGGAEKPKVNFSFGGAATATSTTTPSSSAAAAPPLSDAKEDTTATKMSVYYDKLRDLNQAVSEWIKSHVDKTPVCILTPIFEDYAKHLKGLEDEKASGIPPKPSVPPTFSSASTAFKITVTTSSLSQSAAAPPTFSFSSKPATTAVSTSDSAKTNGFSFGLKKPEESKTSSAVPSTTPATAAFSFGLKPATDSTKPSTGFSFGKAATTSDDSSAPKGFSFGGSSFSLANVKPPEAAATINENEDEDEEPPKNEFKQVQEDDAVYSKKCKVFVKKDGSFVDKGVGTLYLKPVESSGKTQLLVRADTNLGNILVNLILSAGIPSQRMGKNNVMLVCLPTPDVEKPTSMLLRVKTGDEADELLAQIDKYKK